MNSRLPIDPRERELWASRILTFRRRRNVFRALAASDPDHAFRYRLMADEAEAFTEAFRNHLRDLRALDERRMADYLAASYAEVAS